MKAVFYEGRKGIQPEEGKVLDPISTHVTSFNHFTYPYKYVYYFTIRSLRHNHLRLRDCLSQGALV